MITAPPGLLGPPAANVPLLPPTNFCLSGLRAQIKENFDFAHPNVRYLLLVNRRAVGWTAVIAQSSDNCVYLGGEAHGNVDLALSSLLEKTAENVAWKLRESGLEYRE